MTEYNRKKTNYMLDRIACLVFMGELYIDYLLNLRNQFKKEERFGEADKIRDSLDSLGIKLTDHESPKKTHQYTIWSWK